MATTPSGATITGRGSRGPADAPLVLVGEQPGDVEDHRGKRRIHKTPGAERVAACRHWLAAELAIVSLDSWC